MPDKDDRKELVEGTKPFSHFLEMLHDGEFHWECSEKLRDLLGTISRIAADRSGTPKGRIQLTFDVKVVKHNIEVVPKVTVKKPEREAGRAILWLTPGNNPTPDNPRQEKFRFGPRAVEEPGPAREVDEPARTVREV